MQNYLDLLKDIKENGTLKKSRAGDTKAVFGRQLRWNMQDGFPLMTLKKVSFHNIAYELLWFLGAFDEQWQKFGNTNIRYLVDHNVNIWNDDAYRGYLESKYKELRPRTPLQSWLTTEFIWINDGIYSKSEFIKEIKTNDEFAVRYGELGDSYGKQWRQWTEGFIDGVDRYGYENIDQIQQLIENLKNSPFSRRHLVTAWNPAVIDSLTLPPCHYGFQCYVEELSLHERNKLYSAEFAYSLEELNDLGAPKYKLSLMWNQRSVDTMLGLPYNIASYGLLLQMMAYLTNMIPDQLIANLGDTHIYMNQMDAVDEMISREGDIPSLPELFIKSGIENINDFRIDDFKLHSYNPLSAVKAPLSVGL